MSDAPRERTRVRSTPIAARDVAHATDDDSVECACVTRALRCAACGKLCRDTREAAPRSEHRGQGTFEFGSGERASDWRSDNGDLDGLHVRDAGLAAAWFRVASDPIRGAFDPSAVDEEFEDHRAVLGLIELLATHCPGMFEGVNMDTRRGALYRVLTGGYLFRDEQRGGTSEHSPKTQRMWVSRLRMSLEELESDAVEFIEVISEQLRESYGQYAPYWHHWWGPSRRVKSRPRRRTGSRRRR